MMSAAFFLLLILAIIVPCEAQVRRTHTTENPVTITLLRRNREVRQTFHENGSIKSECQYNSGRLDGICEEFFDNGALRSRIEFKNGREHGVADFYRETGARLMRITFNRGKPQETIHYDERGLRIDENQRRRNRGER
ncbi:MAG: hypothetical protein FWE23_04030 [Chitinivibrionia bacterium]|nr:hypothetical protein [Chitinivibrionia bacterium]